MKKFKKSIKIKEVEVIDTSFIYFRVIALQLTNEALKMANGFSFELSSVPTSMFDDSGDMRLAKSKSGLNNTGGKVSFRSMKKLELVVIDGCTILWVINWPTNGLVFDYIVNYCEFVFLKLQSYDIAVVFDRYQYQVLHKSRQRKVFCKNPLSYTIITVARKICNATKRLLQKSDY